MKKIVMQNGLRAFVKEYRSAEDIDVQFEDGKVVKNQTYRNFINGKIVYPSEDIIRAKMIGTRKKMIDGNEAEIIAYRNAMDIDVRFANGKTVEHLMYASFAYGMIKCPD